MILSFYLMPHTLLRSYTSRRRTEITYIFYSSIGNEIGTVCESQLSFQRECSQPPHSASMKVGIKGIMIIWMHQGHYVV